LVTVHRVRDAKRYDGRHITGASLETITAIRRAGADVVLTYWAGQACAWLDRE
jgi:delta-aminolevulinic acid dehydratase/porphobilinogen synthase